MSLFLCPICRRALRREEGRYLCPKGHSYDIAAAGYVHLLPANQKHSRLPGDDKQMAAARNRFLGGGWYLPLQEAIARTALDLVPEGGVFFDSGCGEGYYTAGVKTALDAAGRNAAACGIDISKFSLRWAAKRDRSIEFAVASAYHLPLADQSVDFLLNCFSPLARSEFRRVLKPGGAFLYVVPAPRHLWELKQAVYDTPYENPEQTISCLPGGGAGGAPGDAARRPDHPGPVRHDPLPLEDPERGAGASARPGAAGGSDRLRPAPVPAAVRAGPAFVQRRASLAARRS